MNNAPDNNTELERVELTYPGPNSLTPDNFECPEDIERQITELHQLSISDLIVMSTEERKKVLEILYDGYVIVFSPKQIQELWQRRDELDEDMFRYMMDSVISGRQPRYPDICPFSGLPADTNVSGWYGSTWMDECTLDIHNSIAKDLVNLAYRVGVGLDALDIGGSNGSFSVDVDEMTALSTGVLNVEIENSIGALDEKDIGCPYNYCEKMPSECNQIKVKIITPENTRFLTYTHIITSERVELEEVIEKSEED